jgi:predicted transcriptional regulator
LIVEISTKVLTLPELLIFQHLMKNSILHGGLSRRERQVVEILIRLGGATAREIEKELPDPPTNSAVRSILRILIGKKLIVKRREKNRDIFAPAVPVAAAKTGALKNLVSSFFADSIGDAACALLGQKGVKLSAEEAAKLTKLIQEAKQK